MTITVGVGDLKVFDAHFHIIDPNFPVTPNQGYLPSPFSCHDYLRAMAGHNLVGGAVVSGSFQGFDTGYLVAAIEQLGEGFVGVAQLPASVEDGEVLKLHGAGVRAVRFNLRRCGSESIEHLESLARRLHNLVGWHVELYVDSRDLKELHTTLSRLPRFCVDHLGLSREGFNHLLRLVEQGNACVKATGFGRVNLDVGRAVRRIVKVNPDALLFGTDLPSTRAPRPYHAGDLELLVDSLEDQELADKVLCKNALALYNLSG